MSSPNEAQVVQCNRVIYLVNLATSHCGCRRYAENRVPCSYAIAFIYYKAKSLDAYLLDALKMKTQIAAYHKAMPLISITGLKPTIDSDTTSKSKGKGKGKGEGFERACNPPLTRVPRGCP